jgi:hypothetical protein
MDIGMILLRIPICWDMTLCHWVSGSYVSNEYIAFIKGPALKMITDCWTLAITQ